MARTDLQISPNAIKLHNYKDGNTMGIFPSFTVNASNFWQIGKQYSLTPYSCEGFEMPTLIYELKAIIQNFSGVEINSVVVKQINNTNNAIYSISKNDCAYFGIDYEPGLQLLPMTLNWVPVEIKETPFDENLLSTLPLDNNHNISVISFKINDFSNCIVNPQYLCCGTSEYLIPRVAICTNIYCNVKMTIIDKNNRVIFREGDIFPIWGTMYTNANYIINDCTLFVRLDLPNPTEPNTFNDLTLNDVFEFWINGESLVTTKDWCVKRDNVLNQYLPKVPRNQY